MQTRKGATLVILALTLAGCTSGPNGSSREASPARGGPTASSPLPTDTEPPQLPLQDGRLDGKYNVKVFVTANSFDSKPGKKQTFRFTPRCAEGACDVIVSGVMNFGQGLEERQAAGAEKRFDIRLALLGRSYRGTKVGFWASCGDEPDKDRWTFSIKIDKAKYVDDIWTITRWSGTWSRQASGGPCIPGRLRAVIRGTLAES